MAPGGAVESTLELDVLPVPLLGGRVRFETHLRYEWEKGE